MIDDPDDDDTTVGTGQPVSKPPRPDDSALAERWTFNNPNFAWGMGDWRKYEKGVWNIVQTEYVKDSIRVHVEAARREGVRCTTNLINSVAELARWRVFRPVDIWDASINLLPCKNGVLDINTRTLLPHTPSIYATSQLPFDYDSTADCPNFKKALERIPEAADFLQEFIGYSLTPDTKHEIAVWFYGEPGSGKSTIIEGVEAMLGDRAGLLGLSEIQRSQFALINLPGKTLITSTEQPDAYMNLSELLNNIISGEKITIERKYYDAVQIKPRAKILWAMNNLPRINADNGIMRRVKIIKYPPLDACDIDVTLKEKIKAEAPGILNWALEGLDRLRQRGVFIVPQSVVENTKDYQDHNDIVKQFLDEINARIDPNDSRCKTQSQYLYDQYSDWCKRNNHKPLSSTRMADEWKRQGFTKMKSGGSAYWVGVEVSPYTAASNVP